MQCQNEKLLLFASELGKLIKETREKETGYSLDNFANSFGISKGGLSTIENGKSNCKLATVWLISEAMGLKCSELIKLLEEKLGKDFKFIDE